MTALDRALIKAFSQQAQVPGASTPAARDVAVATAERRTPEVTPQPVVSTAALSPTFETAAASPALPLSTFLGTGYTAGSPTTEDLYHPAPRQQSTAAPQWQAQAEEELLDEDQLHDSLGEPADNSPCDAGAMLAAQPLSSFSLSPGRAVLRPRLEVDRFAWPAVCDLLDSEQSQRFAAFAETLAAGEPGEALGFSSGARAVGCSTIALWVARRLARQGHSVVLVDADLENPDLAASLGIAASAGLEAVLAGSQSLEEVLIRSLDDQLTLVPCCPATGNPAASLDLPAVIDRLRESSDFVVVDCGPADSAALALGALAIDRLYWIFDGATGDAAQAQREAQAALGRGARISGLVENFAPHGPTP